MHKDFEEVWESPEQAGSTPWRVRAWACNVDGVALESVSGVGLWSFGAEAVQSSAARAQHVHESASKGSCGLGDRRVCAGASSSVGLQGLVLDGNRIHNSGGQALLEAVTAAPGLWRFSAEANKLTDPALRLSLTQLSQLRAARRSQLLVLGRQYSSSSSSSGEDPEGQGQNGRRGSGGGGGGADSGRRSDGGGDSHRNSMEEEDRPPSQQHQKQPQNGGGSGNVAGAAMDLDDPQENDGHFRHHHHQHQHKHRLDEGRASGGNSSGDDDARSGERRPSAGGRNVAARAGLNGGPHDIHVSAGSQAAAAAAAMLSATAAAADGPAWRRAVPATMDVASSCNGNGNGCSDAMPTGGVRRDLHAMAVGVPCGGSGGGLGGGCGGAHPMAIDSQPCMPSSAGCGGGGGRPPSVGGASSHDSLFGSYDPPSHLLEAHGFRGGAMAAGTPSRHAPAGAAGARFGGSSSGGVAGGGGGGMMATSPPPAMCYVTAMTGVGGAGSVGVSKQAGGGRGGGGGGGGASGHDFKSTPQQILPACRRPRYKPLTPEQQRMFEDF